MAANPASPDYLSQNNYARALEVFQRSRKIYDSMGNKTGVALTLQNIGMIHQVQGDLAHALQFYEQSLKLRESLGEKAEAVKLAVLANALDPTDRRLPELKRIIDLQ